MTFKDAIFKELDINPDITFDEAQKRIKGLKLKTFKNVKTQWRKLHKKKVPVPGTPKGSAPSPPQTKKKGNYASINLETVHDLLLRWANGEKIDSQLVKHCIDYCKGFKTEDEDIDLDMDVFRNIGQPDSFDTIIRQEAKS